MKFQELLIGAIQRSEIPLRFEPGAEEAVAQPVTQSPSELGGGACAAKRGSEFDAGLPRVCGSISGGAGRLPRICPNRRALSWIFMTKVQIRVSCSRAAR